MKQFVKNILRPVIKPILDFLSGEFRHARQINKIIPLFVNKNGLEIGGPSLVFEEFQLIPIYNKINNCDGVNFSKETVWTGQILESQGYIVNGVRRGRQFITDATNLTSICDETYDFILSCNNIEHIANPLKAIEQWLSKLKKGGTLLIIAPRKESNFDHKRHIVSFKHLLDDYEGYIGEDDLTHLDEILKLHDLELDPPAGTIEEFKQRSLNNIENRCLHHHVFDSGVLSQIFDYFNLAVVLNIKTNSDYIIVGRK